MKLSSTMICPHCQNKSTMQMPTDSCQFFWHCPNCKARVKAKPGDCCVFCSYGDTKCPSKQDV